MVVVPGWDGIDRRVTRVHERPVRSVEKRAGPGRDDDGIDGICQCEVPLVQAHDGFTERQDALCGRVIRLPGLEGRARGVEEYLRDRKVLRIEVADREVAPE